MIPVPSPVVEEDGGIPTSVPFHFLGSAALAAGLAIALPVRGPAVAIGGGFAGASAHGALMGLLRPGLAYRTFGLLDVVIDATDAAVGLVLHLVLVRRSE